MSDTYAVVIFEGNVYPEKDLLLPIDLACKEAKRLAVETGMRVNVFKLVQTHTFIPTTCGSCGNKTANRELPASTELGR